MIMIKLALVLLFGVITAVNCLVTIETTPVLPENVLATDFSGLILRAHFPKGKHLECRWNLVGKYSVTIFSKSKPCSNLTNENPVCGQKKINESTYIFTEYIIKNPITESLNISVACTKGYVTATRQISVTDCSAATFSTPLLSESSNFSSVGRFACNHNETLFYLNGTRADTLQTTCLANAKWSSSNDVECWGAPQTYLSGSTNGEEGENLTFTCNYTDVKPAGNKTLFFYGDKQIILDKGESFKTPPLVVSDNNKRITCQALTEFTRKYNQTGMSNIKHIAIKYVTYHPVPESCVWTLNKTQICKITFSASGNLRIANVSKNNDLSTGIVSELKKSDKNSYTFYYVKENVSSKDTGTYDVHLLSDAMPYHRKLSFNITSVESQKIKILPKKTSEVLIYIFMAIALCLGLYAAVMTILVFVNCKQKYDYRRSIKIKKDKPEYLEPTSLMAISSESDERGTNFTNPSAAALTYSFGNDIPLNQGTSGAPGYLNIPDTKYEAIIPYAETKISIKDVEDYATMLPHTKL